MPLQRNAPKLCPAEPRNVMFTVPSGSPPLPSRRVMCPASIAPTLRSVFDMGMLSCTGIFDFTAYAVAEISDTSITLSAAGCSSPSQRDATPSVSTRQSSRERSILSSELPNRL